MILLSVPLPLKGFSIQLRSQLLIDRAQRCRGILNLQAFLVVGTEFLGCFDFLGLAIQRTCVMDEEPLHHVTCKTKKRSPLGFSI